MSLIVFSDTHAYNWPRFSTALPDGTNSRFADLLGVLAQIERYVEQYKPTALLMLGDLTHQRGRVTFSVYEPLMQFFDRLARNFFEMQIVLLVGNHDIESHGWHALGPLKYLRNVTVVDTPRRVDLGDEFLPFAYFVPYMDGPAVVDACRAGHDGDYTVFLHYALDGKIMGGSEYAVPSALALDDLDMFERIYFGHVHAPAVEYDGRVIYVGAPMHFDFGDVGDRVCWLVKDGINTALPLRAPKFVTTSYPRIGVPPECGGFLRVLGTPADLFGDVQRNAQDAGWSHVVCVEERVPQEAVRAFSHAAFADAAVLRAYVERQYAALPEPERVAILDTGLSYLTEGSTT